MRENESKLRGKVRRRRQLGVDCIQITSDTSQKVKILEREPTVLARNHSPMLARQTSPVLVHSDCNIKWY